MNNGAVRSSRGRPLKFGRPARLLAITLPDDVVHWLKSIHGDPAWAIVSLFERANRRPRRRRVGTKTEPQLAHLGGRRALIVVDPRSCRALPGVSVIPMTADRAFLALDGQRGLPDLELTILDRLDDPRTNPEERRELHSLRRQLREWRRSRKLRFSTRSIILVEGAERDGRTTSGTVTKARWPLGEGHRHRRRALRGPESKKR